MRREEGEAILEAVVDLRSAVEFSFGRLEKQLGQRFRLIDRRFERLEDRMTRNHEEVMQAIRAIGGP